MPSRPRMSFRNSRPIATRAVPSRRSSPEGRRSPRTMRSSRISEPTGEPVSAAISRRMAGASVRPAWPSDLRRAPAPIPIFRLVDGATCPSANVSTLQAKRQAYKLLTDKGLIRIGLPPAGRRRFRRRRRQIAIHGDVGERPVSVHDQPGHRPDEPDLGHRFCLPPAASVRQSRVPEHDHVGWTRTQPHQPGHRRHAWPCAGQCRSDPGPAG